MTKDFEELLQLCQEYDYDAAYVAEAIAAHVKADAKEARKTGSRQYANVLASVSELFSQFSADHPRTEPLEGWHFLQAFLTHCEAEGAVERLAGVGYRVEKAGLFVKVWGTHQTAEEAERLLHTPR